MTSTDPDGQFGDLEIDIDPQAASNSLHKLLNCAYPPGYFDRLDGHRSEWLNLKAGISSKERVTLEEGFAKEQRRLHRLHADHIIANGHPDALETELFSAYQSAMADIECYEGVVFAEGTVPGFKGCPPSLNWHALHNLPSDEEFNMLYSPPPLGPCGLCFTNRTGSWLKSAKMRNLLNQIRYQSLPLVWHIWHEALTRLRQI